jgi:Type II intron maturase/Reverse transcriptase (RNA-dependent DNA polymerase)
MRAQILNYKLNIGHLCFGTGVRLLNDKANRILSASEVMSVVNYSSVVRSVQNGDLKLDVHGLFEKSEIQSELCKVRLSDAIQKKLRSVVKKGDIKNGISLNESLKDVSHKTLDFNIIVAQNERESVNFFVDKIRHKWNENKKKFVGINYEISNSLTLIYAYGEIIKLKNAQSRESENTNFDRIDRKSISVLSHDFSNEAWEVRIARRVWIIKKKVNETTLLTVLSLHDKIIAIAIQIVFNLIFEKHEKLAVLPKYRYLSEYSYGFRHNRGCHVVLNIITKWDFCKWLILVDIVKCYDTINQKKFMSIIQESIDDQILIGTFQKFFNVQMTGVKVGGLNRSKGIGLFTGNLFSPMLINIYLNEFDQFLLRLKATVDKKNLSLCSKAKVIKAKPHFKRKIELYDHASIQQGLLPERVYCRFSYVRYVSDYLIAVRGSKQLAKEVKKRAEVFLKCSLYFEWIKRDLIDWQNNKVCFLGFDVVMPCKKIRANIEIQKRLCSKQIKSRVSLKKRFIEASFTKIIIKAYKWYKLKSLRVFSKGCPKKVMCQNVVKHLAENGIKNLIKGIDLNYIKWFFDVEHCNTWLQREDSRSQEPSVKKTELEKLGDGVIAKVCDNMIKVLKYCMGSKIVDKVKEFRYVKMKRDYTRIKLNAVPYSLFQSVKPTIYAPIYKLKNQLRGWDMLSVSGQPKFCGVAIKYHEVSIIEFFKQIAVGILNYYNPALNFHAVKKLVDYHVRWSLLHTLAAKYSSKVHKIISKFGKSPKVVVATVENKRQVLAEFLTSNDINHRTRRFLKWGDPISFKNNFEKTVVRQPVPKVLLGHKCTISECNNSSIEAYYIRSLRRVRCKFVVEFIKLKKIGFKKKYVLIHSAFSNKQILLCEEHYKLWYIFRRSCLTKQYLKKHIKITLGISTCF